VAIIYGLGHLKNQNAVYQSLVDEGLNTIVRLKTEINQPNYHKTPKFFNLAEVERITGVARNDIRYKERTGKLKYINCEDASTKNDYSIADMQQIRKVFNRGFFNGAVERPSNFDPIIIAVTMFKGGVGKSIHSTHLAAHLVLAGLNVLLCDLDPQASATCLFGYVPDIDITRGKSIYSALLEDPNTILELIQPTHYDGLDIITSGLELQGADIALPNYNLNNTETLGSPLLRLKKALNLLPKYDVIILDCPPNHAATAMNALTAADAIILPIIPKMEAFVSSIQFVQTLRELTETMLTFRNGKTKLHEDDMQILHTIENKLFRVLITNDDGDTESRDVSASIRKLYGELVLPSSMVNTIALARSSNDLSLLYDLKRSDVRKSKESFDRGLAYMKKINNDIATLLNAIWNKNDK
jgi:chromosome partitioning protein